MSEKPKGFKGRALNKFQNARQAALEKMGKTENTVEPEQLKQQTAVLEQHATSLQRSSKAMSKQTKTLTAAADDGMAIADSFSETAGSFSTVSTSSREFVDMCEQIAEFHVGLEDLRLALTAQTAEAADALRALTKAEIRQAKTGKAKYDKVRLAYEAQRSKVTKLRAAQKQIKADEAQRECDEMKESFESAGSDTLELVENANITCEAETVDQLANYLDAYTEYFARAHAWMISAAPLVERSRQFVERRRAELQEREKAALAMAKRGRVFGEQLAVLCEKDGTPVPRVPHELIRFLAQNALHEEGLFRVTGFKSEMAALRKTAESDESFSLAGRTNLSHEVASLLKAFMRELPEPLFTFALYDKFVALPNVADVNERARQCKALVGQLPPAHKPLAVELMGLLRDVAAQSAENKMTPSNLAIVWAPNLFVASHNDPARIMKENMSTTSVFEMMITHHDTVFGSGDALSAAAAAAKRQPSTPQPPPKDSDLVDLEL